MYTCSAVQGISVTNKVNTLRGQYTLLQSYGYEVMVSMLSVVSKETHSAVFICTVHGRRVSIESSI